MPEPFFVPAEAFIKPKKIKFAVETIIDGFCFNQILGAGFKDLSSYFPLYLPTRPLGPAAL
jgi:hypothetical protein